jgi:Skp family chaperone for outer membrane proteins
MQFFSTRCLTAAVFICSVALAPAGHAEGTVPKLGVVDMERLVLDSVTGKKLLAPLDEMVKSLQTEANKKGEDIRRIRDQAVSLNKDPSPENQHVLEGLQQQFSKKMEELDRFQAESQENIDKQRVESLSAFNHVAMPVIESMGKELGYSMIFRKQESGLLFVDEGTDLTHRIIQRLDAPATMK